MTRTEALERVAEAARAAFAKFCERGVPERKSDDMLPQPYWSPAGRMMNTDEMMAIGAALAVLDAASDSGANEQSRRSGFDVGKGAVREGDTALFDGRECKVLTVYHDGDVQIEISTYATVKWRQVSPLPNSQEQKS